MPGNGGDEKSGLEIRDSRTEQIINSYLTPRRKRIIMIQEKPAVGWQSASLGGHGRADTDAPCTGQGIIRESLGRNGTSDSESGSTACEVKPRE